MSKFTKPLQAVKKLKIKHEDVRKNDMKTIKILERRLSELKRRYNMIRLKPHSLIVPNIGISNRELILDCETTGLSNYDGIIELSIIELIEGIKTGRQYHSFFNPVINITKKAEEIHRITNEQLERYPVFSEKVEEIIKFIGNGNIVAHNSNFDMRMLNNELGRCGWESYQKSRFIDTLSISRNLFPNCSNSQDSLCKRFNIDNNNRLNTGIHSAKEDTEILYHIYIKLKELTKL